MNKSPSCDYAYNPRLKKEIEVLEILLAIVMVALGIISLVAYNFLKTEISANIENYGLGALFLITAAIEIVPNIFNPILGLIVALASGFDFYFSMIVCLAAALFGGVFGFELGKHYGFRIVCAMTERKTIEKILKLKEKYGNFVMFIAAISPLPYLPLIFGALLVDRKDFIVYGLIPRLLFIAAAGYLFQIGFIGYNL